MSSEEHAGEAAVVPRLRHFRTARAAARAVMIAPLLAYLPACALLDIFRPEPEFVRVSGHTFLVGNEPYLFAGTNFWYGPYLGSPGPTGDRARLTRELDALSALGVTNLRVLAGSEASYMEHPLRPAIQASPGVLDEALLQGLDVLLDQMRRREMRAVLFLTNYWEWSGGMSQYVAWSSGTGRGPDPREATFTWDDFMDYAARFYADSGAQDMYRAYIRRIVTRMNTVNGLRYAEDPTIMAWQLANEPRPGTVSPAGRANMDAFVRWVDTTAAFIRSLDPNHLVSTGSEGTIGSLVSEENFLRAHRPSHIDYLTVHLWPGIWQWFDPSRPDSSYAPAESLSLAYVRQHIALAREMGKPLVLEEFGFPRDDRQYAPEAPVRLRDRFYAALFRLIEDSLEAGSPLAGSNFWAWGGEGRSRDSTYRWRPGDPLTGDPPHEPQGFHSVFTTDSSTIAVLRDHARRMGAIAGRRATKITTASP